MCNIRHKLYDVFSMQVFACESELRSYRISEFDVMYQLSYVLWLSFC